MHSLIIDRDIDSAERVKAALEARGDTAVIAETRNQGLELIRKEAFDAVFDPAPQSEVKTFLLSLRRFCNSYTPFYCLTHNTGTHDLDGLPVNGFISKPIDPDSLKTSLKNIANLNGLLKSLSSGEDTFSRDGLISKSAFEQIVLSCLERADRHAERSYVMTLELQNGEAIEAKYGAHKKVEISKNLRNVLIKIRRLSDIAGEIAEDKFSMVILRPLNDSEPRLATERFIGNIKDHHDVIAIDNIPTDIRVTLMTLPTGEVDIDETISETEVQPV